MASSSNLTSSIQRTESTEQYEEPFRTLLTPIDNLEVLSGLIVDSESLQENGFNLSEEVKAQGWNRYFDRLLGPFFPRLVKELWIHATALNHQVTSFVMGENIVIFEDLIGQLICHDGGGIHYSDMEDKSYDLTKISKDIFTSG